MLDWLRNIITFIEWINEWVGRIVAWSILAMVTIIVYDVLMRKFFNIGSVSLQELQWHLFAISFLLGAGYTLKYDEHVRVDMLYQSAWVSDKGRAWINLFGSLFLLIPFCLLIITSAYPFVETAYFSAEGSPDGGLPYRYLIKAAIPFGFTLLFLQGMASALRNLLFISGATASPKDLHPPLC